MRDHPAKEWQNRLLFRDRSSQPVEIQIIDLLHDIRFLLFVILLFVMVRP